MGSGKERRLNSEARQDSEPRQCGSRTLAVTTEVKGYRPLRFNFEAQQAQTLGLCSFEGVNLKVWEREAKSLDFILYLPYTSCKTSGGPLYLCVGAASVSPLYLALWGTVDMR